jgi:hypothetical protein
MSERIPLRGGPANGKDVDAPKPNIRYIDVPVDMGRRFDKARYLVERIGGEPMYAQYVRTLRG